MNEKSQTTCTICAIVKDEIRSIVEWVAYYKCLGVNQFLIYDNDSTDGTKEVLKSLQTHGEVTYFDWPRSVGPRPQRMAYEDALARVTSDWVGYFDVDEFLVPKLDNTISEFLDRFGKDIGSIAINWVVFGAGGQRDYKCRPVIERFLDGTGHSNPWNTYVKSLTRRECLAGTRVHHVALKSGRYVNPAQHDVKILGRTKSSLPNFEVAVLNHYAIKSMEEFQDKRNRGNANSPDFAARQARLDHDLESMNQSEARYAEILRFAEPMQREAERLRNLAQNDGLAFDVWPFCEEPPTTTHALRFATSLGCRPGSGTRGWRFC